MNSVIATDFIVVLIDCYVYNNYSTSLSRLQPENVRRVICCYVCSYIILIWMLTSAYLLIQYGEEHFTLHKKNIALWKMFSYFEASDPKQLSVFLRTSLALSTQATEWRLPGGSGSATPWLQALPLGSDFSESPSLLWPLVVLTGPTCPSPKLCRV